MMSNRLSLSIILTLVWSHSYSYDSISQEIDAQTWNIISQSVIDRDIVAMASTYHPDAVLVNSERTATIASTLARWGKGMEKEIEEGSSAGVAFRFSKRMDNENSAFERGIFNYISTDKNGVESSAFMIFESLLVKKDGRWLIIMENQLEETDIAAWDALE